MKRKFRLESMPLYFKAATIGIISGALATLYRVLLTKAHMVTDSITSFVQQYPLVAIAVVAALGVVGIGIGFLVKKYPLIKGSGIPQVKGVLEGHFTFNWLPELLAKFFAGIVAITSGLSLGREGPSIHLGALTASGISTVGRIQKQEKEILLAAGASAGLGAAFNAPMAGIIFSFEELGQKIRHKEVVCIILACISSELVAELLLGQATIFNFTVSRLPFEHYLYLVPLGIICGLFSVLFNQSLLTSLSLHAKIENPVLRPLPAYITAGLLFLFYPLLLGSGGNLLGLDFLASLSINSVILLVLAKLVFSALSYGSGSPGGIFFPLLILGALLGVAYSKMLVSYAGFSDQYATFFIILGMTAFFSGVTRAPITGCVLLSEMTGSLSHLIPLIIVSMLAYTIAETLGAEPIYDALLSRSLPEKHQTS